jgi:2-polyprenyl-3-methyl-5-hydroxy-6-metoxy-1,4-benzoquinol methylase
MFGETIDYFLLKVLAHRRGIATENELNTRSIETVADDIVANGMAELGGYISQFEGNFPIGPNLRYLDIGCGNGGITIALAKMGFGHATGIDFVSRNIAQGKWVASREGVADKVDFICDDVRKWNPPYKYDVLLSFNAFEHIDTPRAFLESMGNLISANGVAVLAFGPLFHSPFGDHMWGFFRSQIPWRGVLFSEKAILKVRREFFRPTDPAERYQDIVGGLNLMRYSEFLKYVDETGWKVRYLAVNPFLRHRGFLYKLSNLFTSSRIFRDYFASTIHIILERV